MPLSGTYAPSARVFYGGTRQCTPLLDRLAPARAAGFTAVSVWPGDMRGLQTADVAQAVSDAGAGFVVNADVHLILLEGGFCRSQRDSVWKLRQAVVQPVATMATIGLLAAGASAGFS